MQSMQSRSIAPTFGALAEHYLATLRSTGGRSYRLREIHWRIYMRDELGALTWEDLRDRGRELVSTWAEKLRGQRVKYSAGKGKRLSPHYISGIFASARLLFRRAIVHGHMTYNPCDVARVYIPARRRDPITSSRAVRALEPDQIGRLLVCPDVPLRFRVEYRFAFFTAARIGEIRALCWGDVHLDAPTPFVSITRTFDQHETKTIHSARRVPLHPQLLMTIAWWRATGWPTMMGRRPEPLDSVFPHGGAKAGMRYANDGLRGHLARAQLPMMTTHGFRHSCATALRSAGVPFVDVAAILGHSVPGVTSEYAKATLEHLAREMTKLQVNLIDPIAAEKRALDDRAFSDRRLGPSMHLNPSQKATALQSGEGGEMFSIDEITRRSCTSSPILVRNLSALDAEHSDHSLDDALAQLWATLDEGELA